MLEFQDCHHGSHLECRNGMNLAVLNLHVSPMPLIKFQLNQTYCSGADIVSGFSSWPPWQPSWILERTNLAILNLHVIQTDDFSNSNSPCGPNASHQVWAQSDVGSGSRCGFKIFKIAAQGYRNGTILVILLEMLKM